LHPLNPTVERQLYIDQSNISHIIKDVWWKGNLLYGKVETALTERGRDMQGLIRQGSKVAFSLRGFGPVCEKKGDITYIKDPLHILTYDFVIHPSHRPAYMTKVLQESSGFMRNELQEGYFIPLTESAIIDYLGTQSKNIKSLSEQYSFDKKNIIGKKKDLVYINDGTDILAVYLEDYINNELDDYLSHM
jgi:hypothetical protein